jgi:hypothetical protein
MTNNTHLVSKAGAEPVISTSCQHIDTKIRKQNPSWFLLLQLLLIFAASPEWLGCCALNPSQHPVLAAGSNLTHHLAGGTHNSSWFLPWSLLLLLVCAPLLLWLG